jgi:molecular chaperone GrpE
VSEPNEERATDEPENGERTVEMPTHDQEFARLKQERDQLEQKLQRALADTANIRRRQKQEMDESRHRTIEGLTHELLPVLDSFTFALQSNDGSNPDPQAVLEGVRLVRTLLSGVLERHGLQEIPAEGLPFDPARHEAVAVEPDANTPEGHVVRVLQTGYVLGDRVVRHSRVVVAGKPNPPMEEEEN